MLSRLFLTIVLLTGYSSCLLAVGLGEYKLYSGLNQPFKADIKLLSVGDLAEHEMAASLASNAEFEKVGVERLFFLNQLRFDITRNNRGELTINVSSREPIKEPFVNFLVELNWPNGRIIREYTFLLDPPIFDDSTSSTIQQAETSTQRRPAAAPQSKPSNVRSTPATRAPSVTGDSYQVAANETLWGIATRARSEQVTVHQMLVAIYRANPDAFINGNINNLSQGAVLTIPDAQQASQVPHRAALQDVVMQNRQWQSGGARRIVSNSGEQSTTAQNDSQGARLSLAAPQNDSSADKSGYGGASEQVSELQNQIAVEQEKSATLQAENDELRARLNQLLKQAESAQQDSLVDIADSELAAITQQQEENTQDGVDAQQEQAAEVAITDDLPPTGTDDPAADIDADSSSELAGTDVADAGVGTDVVVDTDVAGDNTVGSELAQTQANETNKMSTSSSFKTPPEPKGFFEKLLESFNWIWAAAAAGVLLIVAVFWRMRQRMQEGDFQDDLVASTGANAEDSEDFELPDVGDDMLVQLDMDDEEQKGNAENESFDALGEADIYIAYGKYDEAENLLLEAIEDNPIRSDLKVKLMECYVESQNKEKFDALAEEVSQAVDAEEWQPQIDELRNKAWSDETGEGEEAFDLPSTDDIFGDNDEQTGDEAQASAMEEDLDFDTEAQEAAEADSLTLDESNDSKEETFDVNMDFAEDADESQAEASSDAVTQTFDAIDDEAFELDDELATDSKQSADSSNLSDKENFAENETLHQDELHEDELDIDDDIDLDGEDFSFDDEELDEDSGEESGDEISTKLDLARAYIDMGDADGAKEILSEVLTEGNDSQKQEAQELISKAG